MYPGHAENLLGALGQALADRTAFAQEELTGVGGNAVAALLTIGTRPDRSIDELAGVLRLSHSTTVRIVDRLEGSGWVRRTRAADDGRNVLVGPTRSGKAMASRLLEARRGVISGVTDALTAKEKTTLGKLVAKMLASLPHTREDAHHICRLCEHAVCVGERCPVGHAVTLRDGGG